MSDPIPQPSTQAQHPWRATVRTIIAAVFGAAVLLPAVVDAAGVGALPWVASALVITGAITRVLALPGVIAWLERYAYTSWMAPSKPTK